MLCCEETVAAKCWLTVAQFHHCHSAPVVDVLLLLCSWKTNYYMTVQCGVYAQFLCAAMCWAILGDRRAAWYLLASITDWTCLCVS